MKKYLFILFILFSLLLVGCTPTNETVGTLESVVVTEKRVENVCTSKVCSTQYFVTFEKGNTKTEMKTATKNIYNLFFEGSEVNVSYKKNFVITEVYFPELQKNNTKENSK